MNAHTLALFQKANRDYRRLELLKPRILNEDAVPFVGATAAAASVPDFWVYAGVGLKAFSTGGFAGYNGSTIGFGNPGVFKLTDNTTNYIWVDFSSSNIITGTTFPPNPALAFFLLASVVTTGGHITRLQRDWNGGDFVLPCSFPITVASAGGHAGTVADPYQYTASDLAGNDLTNGTPIAPDSSPCRGFPMAVDTAATKGIGYWDGSGSFRIAYCNESTGRTKCGT